MRYLIKNGRIILPDEILVNSSLLISDGKIEKIIPDGQQISGEYEEIDAKGMYVSPGFVDIHQHGGAGYDYMDSDKDAFYKILNTHLLHGTTSVMPTSLSSDTLGLERTIDSYKKAKKDERIKTNLLGLHFEGPYLSGNQAGAQRADKLRNFIPEEYEHIIEYADGEIARWSVAPELDGVEGFAKACNENGIVLSIAHSDADFDTVVKAYDMGFRHITHLYSAMSTITRHGGFRVAGVLEAAYYIDDMNVEIIADGCHIPPTLLKYVTKFKKFENIALITDAIRPAGTDIKEGFSGSEDNKTPIIVEDGVAKLLSREAFAGSIATANRLVRTMLGIGVPMVEAIKMATINPLKMMNITLKKGKLEEGYDADICIFDDDINVKYVFSNGNKVLG